MTRFTKRCAFLISALACALAAPVVAEPGDTSERAAGSMSGYQETPAAINSAGSGEFFIHVHPDKTALDYELRYRGLTGVTQSHIHFGRPGVSGAIVLYLCSNLTPPAGVPAPQPCPTSEGIITGTLSAANVVAQSAQGIVAGDAGFAAILRAIQDGSTYANLHTTAFPGGEIRGSIRARGPFFN